MSNIFEQLMTGQTGINESVYRKSTKIRKEGKKLIPSNKLRVESMKILEDVDDYDELDDEFAKDVDEVEDGEVVLIIDPEAVTDDEIPEDAAADMIGDEVYKCPICGANYVCDCDSQTEAIEVDENGVPVECPICGDDAEQILIGEIGPAEGAGEEVPLPSVDADDAEDETEVEVEVDDDDVDIEIEEDEDDDIIEDSVKRRPHRRARKEGCHGRSKKEELDKDEMDEGCCPECGKEPCECEGLTEDLDDIVDDEVDVDTDLDLVDPIITDEVKEEKAAVDIDAENVYISLDETKLESLMNRFIRENYKNQNTNFKVTKGSYRNNILRLEYVVHSGKKTIDKGVLTLEGYDIKNKNRRVVSLKGRDKGAFTESFTRRPAFIVECVCVRGKVIPTTLKYDFKKRVNEGLVRVKGSINKANLKENLGDDLGKYQKWVDYDMKRYGKISGRTNNFLKKAGLKVVKDEYGDYEVIR